MFAEDASIVHAGRAPQAMATLRNLATGTLRLLGADNIANHACNPGRTRIHSLDLGHH